MIKLRTVLAISLAVALGGFAGPLLGERAMSRILERQAVTEGWEFNAGLGRYNGNWILRSVVARIGLGALVPEEALYYRTSVDSEGRPLDGAQVYVMRFADTENGWPPAGAFWSLTPYDVENLQLIDNPINLYQLGDRTPARQCFSNASAEILISGRRGYADIRNGQFWLPATDGAFDLVLRAYEPSAEMLDGSWMPPEVVRVENPEQQTFTAEGLTRLPGMCQLGGVQ